MLYLHGCYQCYLKQTVHFFQSYPHTVISNKLAVTSLYCPLQLYFEEPDEPSRKHNSNKYQSKAFFKICDQRSDRICDTHKQNISGLIDVLIVV